MYSGVMVLCVRLGALGGATAGSSVLTWNLTNLPKIYLTDDLSSTERKCLYKGQFKQNGSRIALSLGDLSADPEGTGGRGRENHVMDASE